MYNMVLIEEDTLWCDRILCFLLYYGYPYPKICHSLEEGRKYLRLYQNNCELIITAVLFKDGTIFELLKEAEKYKSIPTLFITKYADKELYSKSKGQLFAGYLIKPFHHISFDSEIRILMNNYRQRNPLFSFSAHESLRLKDKWGQSVLIGYDEIIYAQVKANYCAIKTKNKFFLKKISINMLSGKLGEDFIKISRNVIVNKNHITFFYSSKYQLKVSDKLLRVGRAYREKLEKISINIQR